jgi:hypothetical protein
VGFRYRKSAPRHWRDSGWGINATIGEGFSEEENSALRGTIGLELFNHHFDASVYGTLVEDGEHQTRDAGAFLGGPGQIVVNNHDIRMVTEVSGGTFERALSGFAGEVGAHVFSDEIPSTWDFRLFAGAFFYFEDNDDTVKLPNILEDADYEDLYGAKVGAELRVYGPLGLREDTSLYVGTVGRWDNQDEFSGAITAGIRIGLGGSSGRQRFTGRVQDRMIDPIRRDNVAFGERKIKSVRVEEFVYRDYLFTDGVLDDEIIDSVWFADENGVPTDFGGNLNSQGIASNPTTIDDALTGTSVYDGGTGGQNNIIVVTGGEHGQATNGLTTNGLQLTPYMILLSGGSPIALTGATTGNVAFYTPDGDPGVINGTAGQTELVHTVSNNEIIGVGFTLGRVGITADGVTHNAFRDVDVSLCRRPTRIRVLTAWTASMGSTALMVSMLTASTRREWVRLTAVPAA